MRSLAPEHVPDHQRSFSILTLDAEPRVEARIRVATLVRAAMTLLLIGNLGRIPVFSTGDRDAVVLFNDVFVGGMLVAAAFAMVQARSLRLDAVALVGLAFAAVGGFSALLAVPRFGLGSSELAISLGYLVRWLFYFAIYVVAINVLRREDVDGVRGSFMTMVLLFAAFGIVQAAALPNFAQIVYPESRAYADWDLQGHRLVSTFLDPNFAGALILMGLTWELARLSTGIRLPLWRSLLLVTALLLTASRSSVLALLVVGAFLLLVRGLSPRLLKAIAAASVLLAALSPKLLAMARAYNKLGLMDRSAMGRIISWLRGLQMFADHPIIGIGFNTYGFVQERYGYERLFASSYAIEGGLLFVAVMTGIVGLALYCGMIGVIVARGRRIWRDATRSAEDRALAITSAAVIIGLVVHSLFTNSLFLPFLMEPAWIIAALAFTIASNAGIEVDTSRVAAGVR